MSVCPAIRGSLVWSESAAVITVSQLASKQSSEDEESDGKEEERYNIKMFCCEVKQQGQQNRLWSGVVTCVNGLIITTLKI